MRKVYDDGNVTLYQGDNMACADLWNIEGGVLVTDPPYGMSFQSGKYPKHAAYDPIQGDQDTVARELVLSMWGDKPGLVFGNWRNEKPKCRNTIAWCKGSSPGMGDVREPWGQAWEEIYVIGTGFVGKRIPNWVNIPTIVTSDKTRPDHPTPKPVELMEWLIQRCPPEWVIIDPFAGSGATLRAAKNLGRRAIGVEIVPKYAMEAARILGQEALIL